MVSAQGIQSAKQTYMRNSNTTCGIPSKLLRHDANASLMRKSTSPTREEAILKPGKSRVQVRLVRRPVEQAQSRRLAPVLRIIGGQNFIMHDEMCDRFVFQGHSHMFLVSVMNGSSHTARRSDQTLCLVAVPGPKPGGHETSKVTVAYF
ncbi:hypothetical protein NEUTE1DRAFT_106670 [Neurospora tetrasperma FGSC 2508]|uniref:Uncharacterized protein n=1 Tax=Neurospora tetrasperma (strain FGSC 2508 / ATCC MYA-4615 / P0657) TaxID=510951 RepID=F8N0G9_NEUT8|nr:uncharacterized protein NEUTE1DRAFT_106670 [Neurospora tetrasperma FGSC 2508]EGO53797.1 hypothetical protein NEUTE1DRAFT_106670 [Neurospora tetrasperma FGSC 2508]